MLTRERAIETAAELMAAFAERTGLTSERPAQRYLWTDAFAVCNYLELARVHEAHQADLALRLVDQVHHVLGRHRPDDARSGWISGLAEEEGAAHPTRGGLRIGKELPERAAGEPLDEELEWHRDGQYFHYLTRWMHALDQVARAARDARYHRWARELAAAAHAAFVRGPRAAGARRMVWKMSTDLSRALVPSMGQHDPLDGLVTCLQLEASASLLPGAQAGPGLSQAVSDYAAMVALADLRTADPLGLGGLLADAWRLAQLPAPGDGDSGVLLGQLLDAAAAGLAAYLRRGEWRQPASSRLAFRELGLAIGLAALERLVRRADEERGGILAGAELRARVRLLAPQAGLGSALVSFWLEPANRRARGGSERDIDEVMLATSLVPEGFLALSSSR